jgi:inosine-uridine nucleoside N-ribohydrolase
VTRIILDCDPGIDDAIAILLALASPELDLAAVTTVAGNVSLDRTTANGLRVLELAGRTDVPLAAGCDRPLVRTAEGDASDVHATDGLGGVGLPPPSARPVAEHAVDLIARLVVEQPTTLVAVGPLTNVAVLLARHPEAAARIAHLVVMGGSGRGGNVTPAAEFNAWADPEAASRVFSSGIRTTVVGLDVTQRATLSRAEVDRIGAVGRVGKAAADMLRFYLDFAEGEGREGVAMHDPLAVALLLDDGLVTYDDVAIEVECGLGPARGATIIDRAPRASTIRYGATVDRDRLAALLLERLGRLG